jgi:hypothetical protein
VLPNIVRLPEAYYLHCPLEKRDFPAIKAFREWLLSETEASARS